MSLGVFIAVTHLLGAGHLTRAAALGRAFAAAGHRVTLVSGGSPSPLIRMDAIRFVQLAPVRVRGTEFGRLLDEHGNPVGRETLDQRREATSAALRESRPDVVVTELFPFGRRSLSAEFEALVAEARSLRPHPLIVCSVRDILVAPSKPERIEQTHARLLSSYDLVLVHGDETVVPLEASWPVDDRIRPLVRYTGYIDDGVAPHVPGPRPGTDRSEVVVSGGSSAASLPLFRAALRAAELVSDRPWRVLVGRGVDDASFSRLEAEAPANVQVERARPDFRALLAGAALSVSQAGYNTAVDLLRSGVRSILVPFEGGAETEQRLRAENMAAHGWASLLPEAELSTATLAEVVQKALERPAPALAGNVALDGAERSVAIVGELAAGRAGFVRSGPSLAESRPAPGSEAGQSGPVHSSRPALAGRRWDWSPLDLAFRRALESGRTPKLWWRDDDAVAVTPALDRLLNLARRCGAPVAICAIPALVEPSLPDRLAAEPLAGVLVHGLAHANHAAPGRKKAEFGPDRPLPDLIADAREGLRLAQAAFGPNLLPVFVPPWNRIAPPLVGALAGIGYGGLSTFGGSRRLQPSDGLVRADTHLDPIDWRGSRGLLDPEALIRDLAAILDQAPVHEGAAPGPIGLLTHHRIHDEAIWIFLEALLDRLSTLATAVLLPAQQVFRDRTNPGLM